MKKVFIISGLLAFSVFANAQLPGILNRAKQRAENKVNEKVNKKTDDAVDSVFKEKNGNANPDGADQPKSSTDPTAPGAGTIKAYSKYDFVPGERIVAYDDLMQDAVGDFPDKWNTNSTGETVTLDGIPGHWLRINKQGIFMPEFIDSLPENFTYEFDLLCDNPGAIWSLYTSIVTLADRNHPDGWQTSNSRFTFTVAPQSNGGNTGSILERSKDGVGEAGSTTSTKHFSDKKPVHVAVWRQKERIRVYFDEEKAWDLPKAMSKDAKYNAIVYWLQGPGENASYFMSNFRVAVGIPDTRNKILTQNKWVTHGILFDVNSDKIKPESYGTLKEMANVLKEFADVKIKIVGHTDSDGTDAANLDLSKRRAAAVKASLASEFSIDESRMETDGKGESEPLDKTNTPAAKANNRRVEFIKI